MKRLAFHYHLKIYMDAPVHDHHFTLRCAPETDDRQQILSREYSISPKDYLAENSDSWGNRLIYGCCRAAHTSFEANVFGHGVTGLCESVPSENSMKDRIFAQRTSLTKAGERVKQLAETIRSDGGILGLTDDAMLKVHEALVYVPGVTTVKTTAEEALAARKGVCQDYAQVMVAVLREKGIPARYVAGMLLGEGKSHAWVEVLANGAWYGFDPTACERVLDRHIKLSHGRDFEDCRINRGIFKGSASQKTEISVIVTEE